MLKSESWSENVIIVDADYVDKVAFDLIVNFERIIGRRIPKADMARWIDCVALDGGLREGEHQTQVILVHEKKYPAMNNFMPGDYEKELNGKAFKDNLGEFIVSSFPVEHIADGENLFMEALAITCKQKEVKRIMVIPDCEKYDDEIRQTLHRIDDDEKRITVFSMQPMQGGNYKQEILGYSLMNALGIKGDEIK